MTLRREATREKIKEAFLALLETTPLEEITMAELARAAAVSRSTLYSHFANVCDVFSESVADFYRDLRPRDVHLRCSTCLSADERGRPLCMALRDAGKYQALVKNPSFLSILLRTGAEVRSEQSTPQDKAHQALERFQVCGCYFAAMGDFSDEEWSTAQKLLDTFIRSGRNAVRDLG